MLKKAINPSSLLKTMDATGDSSLLFKKQVQKERQLSDKLGLRSSTQEKLHDRHSMAAIDKFLRRHAKVIATDHYLYELPCYAVSSTSATFHPNWCSAKKKIYPLDSHYYCLFTRQEYKAAQGAGIAKGTGSLSLSLSLFFLFSSNFLLDLFVDIASKPAGSKTDKKKNKHKKSKKSSKTQPISLVCIEGIAFFTCLFFNSILEEEDAIIDVLSNDCEELSIGLELPKRYEDSQRGISFASHCYK